MYARIQTTDRMPDLPDAEGDLKRLVDTIAGHPGFAGLYALRPPDPSGATLVTLWHTEGDASQASDRTRAELGPRRIEPTTDLLYEVRDDLAGVSADAVPTAAGMVWHRPMTEAEAEVGRRARRERIAPVVLAVPGYVRMLALFQPDAQQPCLLNLITSAEVGPALQQAAESVQLPPEEQWLRTPERVELYTVAAVVPAT